MGRGHNGELQDVPFLFVITEEFRQGENGNEHVNENETIIHIAEHGTVMKTNCGCIYL